jgi:carbonic anhydrase
VDAIDRVVMNARLHYIGSAARIQTPVQKIAVLACMDARIDVGALLGLRPGDAHVIRNAGGRATDDARRALAISQVIGTVEIMVIHHTDCAMGRFKQSELAEKIASATGYRYDDKLGVFEDPIEAIVEDVQRLRLDIHLAQRKKIRGFMYDLEANTLTETPVPEV